MLLSDSSFPSMKFKKKKKKLPKKEVNKFTDKGLDVLGL